MKFNMLFKRITSIVELRYDIFKEEISYLVLLLLNIIIFTLIGFSTFLVLHWYLCKLFFEIFMYYSNNVFLSTLILIGFNAAILGQITYMVHKRYQKIQIVAKETFG